MTNDEDNKYDGVLPNSPAEKAGLKKDDLILEVNGIRIDSGNPLNEMISNYQANQVITLRIYKNGVGILKNVNLEKWPEYLDPLEP